MPTLERIFVVFDDHGREEEFELTRVVDDLTSLVHLLVTGQVQSRSATRSTGAQARTVVSQEPPLLCGSRIRPHAGRMRPGAIRAEPQTSRASRATVGYIERLRGASVATPDGALP